MRQLCPCGLRYQPLLLKKKKKKRGIFISAKIQLARNNIHRGRFFQAALSPHFPLLSTQKGAVNPFSCREKAHFSATQESRLSEEPSTPKLHCTVVQRAQHPHRHGSLQTFTAYLRFLVGSRSLEKSGTFVMSPAWEKPELLSQTHTLISW